MLKLKKTFLPLVCFALLLAIPAVGYGDTPDGSSQTAAPQSSMPQAAVPETPGLTPNKTPGASSFGIYYGRPYYYAPYYYYYPYRPYFYHYYYYPYRPYYYYYGW